MRYMPIQKASEIDNVDVITTGLVLDRCIGTGGLPKQRIVEVTGNPGAGKSTICLQAVAAAQKLGQRCLWADVEGSFTPQYASLLGVDMDLLDVLRERDGEAVLNMIMKYVEDEAYDLIVIDSIGSITSRAELEKDIGEVVIGGQAKIVGQFARKLALALPHKKVCVLAINHTRTDIMTGKSQSRGGESWNYHKAIRIHMSVKFGVQMKQGDKIIGQTITFEVKEKNKMFGNKGMKIDSAFINNQGFSASADLMQDAIDAGIFEKINTTFYFEGEKIGQISKLREWMSDPVSQETVKAAM
jgi:recombination protein RecA